MRATLAVVLTLVFPGTGHLLIRRYLKGVVLAALFAVAVDVFLVSAFLLPFMSRTALTPVALAIGAAVWLFALIDLCARLKSLRANEFQKTKDDLLKAAQVAWLKDDTAEAERLLGQILRMDERDVEAWIHLGKVLKSCGRPDEARICFRSALNLDGNDAWRWQLMRELGYTDVKQPEPKAS